jgi:DNA-directed RNA polymerase subunit RPC12/RpoP
MIFEQKYLYRCLSCGHLFYFTDQKDPKCPDCKTGEVEKVRQVVTKEFGIKPRTNYCPIASGCTDCDK